MDCSVRHKSFYGVAHKKYLETDNNFLRTIFSKPYVLDPRTISNTARNVCYGKTRKENALLLRKIDAIKDELRRNLKKYREEKSNLEQVVFHLSCQREGMSKKVIVNTSRGQRQETYSQIFFNYRSFNLFDML